MGKILCVEDGSVNVDYLAVWCKNNNIELIIYRQGSKPPFILETKGK